LKQVAITAVPTIDKDGMAGQQPTHHSGYQTSAGAQQQIKMIGDQRLGKAVGFRLLQDLAQPFHKIVSISIIFKIYPCLMP
jgi:hypothetical protein